MFSDSELRDVLDSRKRAIAYEIDSLTPNYILNANFEDLCTSLEQKDRYQTPILRIDEVCLEQDEVDIDVSQDFNRGIYDRSQPFYVKGTSITFVVPFDGDSALFRYRPSAYTSSLPYGEVGQNELRLEYRSADYEGQRIKSAFDQNIREIQQYLGFVSENITQFNDSLARDVRERINERRDKLLKDQNLAASLGVPMKKREGVPQTYSVPVARKKLAIQLPPASTNLFEPEPAEGV